MERRLVTIAKRFSACMDRVGDISTCSYAALENLSGTGLTPEQQSYICDLVDNMFVYAAQREDLAIQTERGKH